MTALTRFPSRIRFVNQDGTLTPEALRMLDALISRVGGAVGDSGIDMFAAPTNASDTGAAPDVVASMPLEGYMSPVDRQPGNGGQFFETTYQGSSE